MNLFILNVSKCYILFRINISFNLYMLLILNVNINMYNKKITIVGKINK